MALAAEDDAPAGEGEGEEEADLEDRCALKGSSDDVVSAVSFVRISNS